MSVIVTEEYVCDYYTKRISNADVLVGRLSLRKQGARGLGREVGLTPHPACLDNFTARATGVARTRRSRSAAQAVVQPEIPAEPEALPARRRRKQSP